MKRKGVCVRSREESAELVKSGGQNINYLDVEIQWNDWKIFIRIE